MILLSSIKQKKKILNHDIENKKVYNIFITLLMM